MNKAIQGSFMILCFLSILLLMGCKTSVKASPTPLTVDDDGSADFKTIQEAINNATSGDTIFVRAGEYHEHVIVNKSVSLIGEDSDSTIVDGNETGSVMNITANNVEITGFTIRHSGHENYDSGIYIGRYFSNNLISHNTIANNGNGMYLFFSYNNVVSGNTITNSRDGIRLDSSGDNVVSGNIITENRNNGMYLFFSYNNVVSGNTITNSRDNGISLFSSKNNVVSGNTMTNNRYGMLAFSSSNNTVHCNNFNNTYQTLLSDSVNVWDDGDEGNYWRDYNGTDANQNGIGDTSYNIDVDNIDRFPLMGMFSDFSVTSKEEEYHVTTICNSIISEFRFEIGLETGNRIIRFNVTGKDGTAGFCRITIPTELMSYPYIVVVDVEEIVPTYNETYSYLYFTYIHSSHTVTIISSRTRQLQIDLDNLNATYYDLLNNYSILFGNYSQLQKNYHELNNSYHWLLNNYSILFGNYNRLQESYGRLNNSYQEHLLDYSRNVHNIQNLMYIFAATTGIFIMTTIYLSKRAHEKLRYPKTNVVHAQETT